MMIDILMAKDNEVKRIIQDALEAASEEGRVMVGMRRPDLAEEDKNQERSRG